MTMPITLNVELNQSEWIEFFKTEQRLKPYRLQVTVEYAEALEYGSGPLCEYRSPHVEGGRYTYDSIYDNIDKWAKRKLKMTDAKNRRSFVKSVVDRMWLKGMYPHVYFRPGIEWVQEHLQSEFDRGHSIKEILEEGERIINKMIMDKGLPDTGALQQSLSVVEITSDEIERVKSQLEEKISKEDLASIYDKTIKELGW